MKLSERIQDYYMEFIRPYWANGEPPNYLLDMVAQVAALEAVAEAAEELIETVKVPSRESVIAQKAQKSDALRRLVYQLAAWKEASDDAE